MSSPKYGYLLDGDCLAAFADAGREKRKLLGWFEELAANPFLHADFEEFTPAGRKIQIVLRENWLISFWPDDAAKKIWIVDLVRVGEK